jgi:predicted phosphodiesterase
MRIAVLADIHANIVALRTAAEHFERWQPDRVIVLGDLVNRGPRPAECLQFVVAKVEEEGWLLVRGNHEDYVISQADPEAPKSGPVFDVHRASYWTYQKLSCDVSDLEAMPFQQSLVDPLGGEVRFVHASMQGNRIGIYPETSESELDKKISTDNSLKSIKPPNLLCVGHTHRPLIRKRRNTLVVNAGSTGLPFDGDTRLAYARLQFFQGTWQARIVRLEYDLAQAERDFYESGYLNGGGPLVKVVLHELRTASSQLYFWAEKYQYLALAGDISMQFAVSQYLQNL